MKLTPLLASGVLCTALLATAAAAQAQAPATAPAGAATATGPSKIAMINIQDAIMTTEEGKKLNTAMQTRFEPKRTELQNDQKTLTQMQSQLNAGGNTMSQQAKDQLTREIATKQRDFQQEASNAQSDYQNAQTDLMNTVGNKMMPIIKTYAEQHGYTVIMDASLSWPQSPVLYFNPGTVITDQIIKLYDAAHPVSTAAPAKK